MFKTKKTSKKILFGHYQHQILKKKTSNKDLKTFDIVRFESKKVFKKYDRAFMNIRF